MIELSASMFWINLSFVGFALLIFMLFYIKGMLSSLYDILIFTIVLITLVPIAQFLAMHFPLINSGHFEAGLLRILVARFANPIIWGTIVSVLILIVSTIFKKPLLRRIPLTINRKLDKALSFVFSSIVVFMIGTIVTSTLLTPLFANGDELVNNSILVVFKRSAQELLPNTPLEQPEFTILTKMIAQQPLTLDDYDDIITFVMSFEVPRDIATTVTRFLLALEVSQQELDAVVAYAQERGLTIDDIRALLSGAGLSEAYINQLLDNIP